MTSEPVERRRGFPQLLATAIIVVVVLVVVVSLASAAIYDRPGQSWSLGPPAGASVADISNSPNAYMGQYVTLFGQVDQVLSPESITVSVQGAGGPAATGAPNGPSLLVVGKAEVFRSGVAPGDLVQVTGTVGSFVRDRVDQQLGVTLDQQKFAGYEGKPAVLAQSVSKSSGS